MQPITPVLASILATNSQTAAAEIAIQGPNPNNSLQPATQILLDGVSSINIARNQAPTADTVDIQIANPDGRYSPLRNINPPLNSTLTQSYADSLKVGRADWKALVYLGLQNNNGNEVQTTLYPQGTFLLQTTQGTVQYNANQQTSHGFDISQEFDFQVSAFLPHTLFGNQTDIRYDPNYNLDNPSGDYKTYVCDAKRFMVEATDNIYLSADYTDVFGQAGGDGAINVYVGSAGYLCTVPVSSSSYTWDPVGGVVTFDSEQYADDTMSAASSGATTVTASSSNIQAGMELTIDTGADQETNYAKNVVGETVTLLSPLSYSHGAGTKLVGEFTNISIDGVPQGMSPELMLWHLFHDYGNYSPDNYDFDTTNIILPAYNGTEDTVWDIGQTIAQMTAPRGVQWYLRIDEFGNIRFYEDTYADTPLETLVDEADFLTLQYTYTSANLVNVAQAQSYADDGQPLMSIAYNVDSINTYGQQNYFSVNSTLLQSTQGLPALYAMSFLNSLTAVQVQIASNPVMQLQVDVTSNPARQVGDKITVIEQQNGLSGPYVIQGINRSVQNGQVSESLQLNQAILFANYNFGLPSAVTNSPAAGSIGDTNGDVNATVSGRTNIVASVTINGTTAITGGSVVTDKNNNPVIPSVSGNDWTFAFEIDPTQNYDTAFYQVIYLECANTLSGTDLMAIRLADWVAHDGTVIPAATVGDGYSYSQTHTSGCVLGSGENAHLYSGLVFPAMSNGLAEDYPATETTLTYIDNTGLTGSIGMATGYAYTGNYAWLPINKFNYGYYVIVAFNASGATSLLRVPFTLNL